MSSVGFRNSRRAFVTMVALALVGCGGSDTPSSATGNSLPSTLPSSTVPVSAGEPAVDTGRPPPSTAPSTAPSTIPPPAVVDPTTVPSDVPLPEDEKVLFADLAEFVEAYDLANETVAVEPEQRFMMTVDSLTTGALPTGGNGFVATDLFEAGIVAGTIDPDGTISALTVLVDPDGVTADPAVTSLLVATLGTAGSFDVVEFADTYRPFALDRIGEPEAQFWLPGPDGSPYSLVGTIVQGAEPPDNLIEIAIVPIPTQNEAQVVVQFLRPELLALDASTG